MARIRTIKPDFWTDEKIVRLPFEARLLFIGLWNFCDDDGWLFDEPDRLKMQIFPSDPVDIELHLDTLVAAGIVDRYTHESGHKAIYIHRFKDHQKISHPTDSRIAPEITGKIQISLEVRREIAIKYGCSPGEKLTVQCYSCHQEGIIYWPKTYSGKPGYWVAFSGLEISHFTAESKGGDNSTDNIVLCCRRCNRAMRTTTPAEFASRIIPENSGALLPEGKGRERKGSEDKTLGRNGSTRFPEFWAAYPKKVKKSDALKKWKLKHLDDKADEILADIEIRLEDDKRWKDGFIPDPTTYINGERWNDEVSEYKEAR